MRQWEGFAIGWVFEVRWEGWGVTELEARTGRRELHRSSLHVEGIATRHGGGYRKGLSSSSCPGCPWVPVEWHGKHGAAGPLV
ncbi:hypothetical protein FKM82_014996 [Ascaphus truei]